MKDVMDENSTVPGKFNVLPRTAEFKGKLYHYPCYKTEDIADEAIQAIVLQYNMMIDEISNDNSERNKRENSFKCASVLLFGLLTLHPFAYGNGRLARLLCSHCLNVFSPFPTAIYNVFSPFPTAIYNVFSPFPTAIYNVFSPFPTAIYNVFSPFPTAIYNVFSPFPTAIYNVFSPFPTAIYNVFSPFPTAIYNVFSPDCYLQCV